MFVIDGRNGWGRNGEAINETIEVVAAMVDKVRHRQ